MPKANHRAVGTSYFYAIAGSMIELRTADNPIVESMHPKASEINFPLNQVVSKTGTAIYTEPVPDPITPKPIRIVLKEG